jgi:hypothetical protein
MDSIPRRHVFRKEEGTVQEGSNPELPSASEPLPADQPGVEGSQGDLTGFGHPGYLIPFNPPTIPFDGFIFAKGPEVVLWIYLAHKARNGDQAAAELLNLNGVIVRSADMRYYWPMIEKPSVLSPDSPNEIPGEV